MMKTPCKKDNQHFYFLILLAISLACSLPRQCDGLDDEKQDQELPQIPVYTISENGILVPSNLSNVQPDDIQLRPDERHEFPSVYGENEHASYENTSRGPQKVHFCHGHTLVAHDREQHLHLHHHHHHRQSRSTRSVTYGTKAAADGDDDGDSALQLSSRPHAIETLLVGDFGLYVRFLAMNNNNPGQTLLAMTDYYANIIKSTPLGAPWTENTKTGVNVRSEDALTSFAAFANRAKSQLMFDHAALISGYDLRTANQLDILGVAYTFGVCSRECASVTEESFTEQTANTLAHEIGHSIGASHDSDDNPCSASAFNVMAPSSALPTSRALGSNPWIFSTCSRNTIRSFLSTSDADCTLSNSAAKSINIGPYVVQEYGQRVTADQQCQKRYGIGSRFCRESYLRSPAMTFDDMYYNMNCFNPAIGLCVLVPASDGTSCGDRKWCFKGSCLATALAPPRRVHALSCTITIFTSGSVWLMSCPIRPRSTMTSVMIVKQVTAIGL